MMATESPTRVSPLVRVLALAGAFSLPTSAATAGPPVLVGDIAGGQQTLASSSHQFVRAGGFAWFTAYDPDEGWELWRTDGTPGGTERVTALVEGPGPMRYESAREVGWLAAPGDVVLFTAWDAAHGMELWRVDASGEATLVKDIAPGPVGSDPGPLTVVGGRAFFAASEPATGSELWVTDGTADGTRLVKDEQPGPFGISPISITAVGDRVFYTGASSSNRWRVSDGTATGTGLFEGAGWFLADAPAGHAGALYFQACAKVAGQQYGTDCELWGSPDGTMASAARVADIAPGTASSKPTNLVASPNGLLFSADPSGVGSQWLWRYDGQAAAAVGSYTFDDPVRLGDFVYFAGTVPGTTSGLYRTDGTVAGTTLVELRAGAPLGALGGAPIYRTLEWDSQAFNYRSYLKATLGAGPGSVTLMEIEYSQGAVFGGGVELAGRYVFGIDRAGDDTENLEPWVTDGTPSGTQLLKDVRTEAPGSGPSRAVSLEVGGQTWFLFAACPAPYDCRVWQTDGTSTSAVPLAPETSLSFPRDLVAFGGRVYFTAGNFRRLYWTDGAGTHLMAGFPEDYAGQQPPVVAGPYLYFALQKGGQNELWRVDGAGAATRVFQGYAADLTPVGDDLFFYGAVGSQSVYRTDGTNTVRLQPDTGDQYTNPYELTPVDLPTGRQVFFRAYGYGPTGSASGGTGQELWATDGTVAGTRLVRDIDPLSSLPMRLTAAGPRLFFTAWDSEHGRELWTSDGTAGGTTLVKDITDDAGTAQTFERSGEMQFRELVALGDTLLFTTWSPGTGVELWSSDGTEAGTNVVRDVVPGPGSSYPTDLVPDGGTAFFAAWDPEHGRELWQTDGTEAGTVRVADIAAGPASSSPGTLSMAAGALFLSATVDAVGREPWRVSVPRVRVEPPAGVDEGGSVVLVASATGDGLTFAWDLDGDGAFEVTGLAEPSVTFSAAGIDGSGSRVVRVRAADAAGVMAIAEAVVPVVNVAPVVAAGADVTLAPGRALDRSGSFDDPGPDSWTATVDYGDGGGPVSLALTGTAFALSHSYAAEGAYTVTVTVTDDDGGSGSDRFVVTVSTVAGTIGGLIEEIEGLIDDGTLKRGQGKSLIGKLELALYMLEWGNTKKAVTMLEAFVHEVEAFRNAGILDEPLADDLIARARAAIASISG